MAIMNLRTRLGVLPSLMFGLALFGIGIYTLNYVVNSWWPFDVARLDLVRATALDRVDATSIIEAANIEIILAFLGTIFITITGLSLPLAFVLNKRFSTFANVRLEQSESPRFFVTLRQSMAFGLWITFCVWLQMNRALGIAVALLVLAVLILFEILLQLRSRAVHLE
jgi:hypothetical protein